MRDSFQKDPQNSQVLVIVRSNNYIYYLSNPQLAKVHEQVISMKIFVFLTLLSALYESSRNVKRALPKPARERHAPIERLGPNRNQYGGGLLRTEHVCSNLDQK